MMTVCPGKEKLSTTNKNVDNFFIAPVTYVYLWLKLAWAFFSVQGISIENLNFSLTFYFY